jgi:hypothetical protein
MGLFVLYNLKKYIESYFLADVSFKVSNGALMTCNGNMYT